MIDFRYHLVSIISIFIALAVGIVLGAGPLDKPIDRTVRQQAIDASNASKALRSQNDELTSRLDDADAVLTSVVPAVVGGRLDGRDISIVALPGTPGSELKQARDAILAAGAVFSGSVSLTSDWVSTDRAADLDAVLAAHPQPGVTVPQGSDALPERAATELAHALVTTLSASVGSPDAESETLLKALRDKSFLRIDEQPWARSALVVVLAPTPDKPVSDADPATVSEATRQRTALVEVPRRISQLSSGTVVAGQTGSAGTNGMVAEVRSGGLRTSVSTVDDLDTPAGRLALPLAVLAESTDETGHYGTGQGADSQLPDIAGITAS
ncbi:copper transport outer membrane protein MctB [Motilibacter peucedani]|uniref:Copper transport outer membrane protein MctB n=1 Tax=Motilibacter peucedani TaxID=598650 RepID=A0A420XSI2_9ACTN|nr:copper transporter [Motilibacter peucedani]RKS77852.1 copper transport outer membrane protein MctB [Motilibacter peucedani]